MALSPSERIRLIRDVSQRLGEEEYPLIDLTLRQFGLPWTESWSDTKLAYVIQMVEGAADGVLLELARHVGARTDVAAPRVEPAFWRPGMFRVFISHLAAERAYAADLQKALQRYGITSFVAHNDIVPTLEWQVQIETALATTDSLVALLHPNFQLSAWTDQEIGFAMGRGLRVFTVRLGQDPYGFMGPFQAFNGLGKDPRVLAFELFNAYRSNKDTQVKMGDSLVGLFEQSESFAEAKRNVGYLNDLVVWDPSFSSRVAAAVKANGQIAGSWGVPERVDALLLKWGAPPVATELDDEIPW